MHESEKVNLNHSKESVLGLLIIFENVYVINLQAQPLVSLNSLSAMTRHQSAQLAERRLAEDPQSHNN